MDWNLTEEQSMVRRMARDFAQNRLRPEAGLRDKEAIFPVDIFRECAELGLMGVNIPAEYGGSEMGVVAYSLVITELSRECAATAVTVAVTNMVAEIIAAFGTEAQKRTYIPMIMDGRAIAGAFALSEAGAGTDAASLRTTAKKDGDHYVLDGEKMWITSGAYAKVAIVMARTGGPGAGGISAFIVTPDMPGFGVGREEEKLGLNGSNTVSLVFDGCRVPAENLLGQEGEGFKIAMKALDGGRIGVASQALGIASGALEAAVVYGLERKQFGRQIVRFGMLQDMVADMATKIEAARMLIMRAAWLKEQGTRRFSREAAMAKLYSTEMANQVCGDAVQMLGGYGYTKEFTPERYFREARVTTIYEGTSQAQKIVISRDIFKQFAQGH